MHHAVEGLGWIRPRTTGGTEAVWTNYYGNFSDERGYRGSVAVFPRVWHGDYTIVLFPDSRSDEPTITTPVTVADGELTVVDWR